MKIKMLVLILLCCLALMFSGCSSGNGLLRPSPYFGGGVSYPSPDNIGQHGYKHGGSAGMLYTCNGGYIDLGHLRESADRTKCVFDLVYPSILRKQNQVSFKLVEPAVYYVQIGYPSNWDSLSVQEKQRIAKESSIELAEYAAHKSLIWHETITWYGWSCTRLFPEKPSAFSWEDIYSDALGCKLGAEALSKGGDYNLNMTLLISQELKKLNVQSSQTARYATQKINGSWFSGGPYPFISMNKRNFDVLDGEVNPWLVPGMCSNCNPIPCPYDNLASISRNGFTFNLELEAKSLQGQKAARIATNGRRICPEKDFPTIIRRIRGEAIREKGSGVDRPTLY